MTATYDAIIVRGLCYGPGDDPDGQVCVEQAVALALGQAFGDHPADDVLHAASEYGRRLNDAQWSSPTARAAGLREYGLAQVEIVQRGDRVDERAFAVSLALRIGREVLPPTLRESLHALAMKEHAVACERATTMLRRDATNAATAAACAVTFAAGSGYDARDRVLALAAKIATECLRAAAVDGGARDVPPAACEHDPFDDAAGD